MAVSGNVAGTAKRGVSYAPNQALIKGQGDVAQSKAAADVAGGIAFAENFTGAIVKGIQEQEKRDAIREAYLDDLKNPQNMRKIEDGYNKQAITEFLNKNKEEYNKAVDCFTRTKDRGCKEQIEDIKFRFSNLNTQLDLYLNDKKSYLDAFGNKQLVDLPGDEKYTELYTNKGAFSIEENGDLGFTINNEYNKYNDIVGKWNVNNNIYDTHILKSSFNSKLNGQKGLEFNRDIERNSTAAVLKTTGPEGVMTATRSDFGFDDDYVLPNGKKAGKLTFEAMFANGMLADKYYDGSITGTAYKKGDSSWFWDKNNSKDLTNLLAEYSTDVNQSMHEQGLESFNAKRRPQTKRGSVVIGGSQFNMQTYNDNFVPYINKVAKLKDNPFPSYEKSPTGVGVTFKDGKYYVVDSIKDGVPIVDKNLGPMDIEDFAKYEGWNNAPGVNFNKTELK